MSCNRLAGEYVPSTEDRHQAVNPTVAVIVTCFNHGRFLADALDSLSRQTYSQLEVVIVDDGSEDDTPVVARTYEWARYVYQRNSGLSAARNRGIRESTAPLLVFLDADDVLAPCALEVGVRHLQAHPECAFVSGDYRLVGPDLAPLFKARRTRVPENHYGAFLRGNFIGMHATVMYRRTVLEAVGGFDESLHACEDYALYLRISREHPVYCHGEVVADYRQHAGNLSRKSRLMLASARAAKERELPFVLNDPVRLQAYREGDEHLNALYRRRPAESLRDRIQVSGLYFWLRHLLYTGAKFLPLARDTVQSGTRRWLSRIRRHVRYAVMQPGRGRIGFGSFRNRRPSAWDGTGVETVIEWYCRRWREMHRPEFRGAMLDVDRLEGELPAALRSVPSGSCDSILCLHRLQHVYQLRETVSELHRILKPGGALIAALPGTTIGSQGGGGHSALWRFTTVSVRALASSVFEAAAVETVAFGNIVSAVAALHEIPADQVTPEELLFNDSQYPVVIGLKATKTRGDGMFASGAVPTVTNAGDTAC